MGGLRQHDLTTGGLYETKASMDELLHAQTATGFPWPLVARNLRNGQLSSSQSCHQYAVEKGVGVENDKEQREAEWRTAVDLTTAATGKLIDDFIAGTRPADMESDQPDWLRSFQAERTRARGWSENEDKRLLELSSVMENATGAISYDDLRRDMAAEGYTREEKSFLTKLQGLGCRSGQKWSDADVQQLLDGWQTAPL
ncbi:unnamed protein product [Vitrella brassicaformis CCMP3155]|uniref:Uncharacterized protein n=1 Tax=Vitrella brassicaformis (strain CCMP3155) TaxID=1169540 RepID=A0A0G4EUQ2_VITBC|nr:unnamed protein product [Vitrella brassicaformis CCMP3155]|eukprot:CEM02320.1 unnamed protein product [Vitrella brassicaformis CCMP3155]